MRRTMTLPELGENVTSVDVVSVLVAAGDSLALERSVVEVETEKAAVEVPSTVAGTVLEIHVKPGDSLKAGDAILTVEDGVATQAGEATAPAAERRPAGAQPTEATPAPPLARPPHPTTLSPAPAPAEPAPPTARPPRPTTLLPAPAQAEPEPPPVAEPLPASPAEAPAGGPVLVPAAPSVRRFARELGVDVAEVQGTGPGGRIAASDVTAHARRQLQVVAEKPPGGVAQPQLPDFGTWGPVREEPMSRVRRLTAEQVARAWSTVPQVTHNEEADITELTGLRERYRSRVEAAGGKLTVTAILVKVAAAALRRFPRVNASVDMSRQVVILKDYVHVGVAVDTEHGLLVPVIRDADRKSITSIAVELEDLAHRARSRKLMPDELAGASFTISNLGGIGGVSFSPIVNWPQAAILGVSHASERPVWRDGQVQPRLILPLALSYDHRVVDGAEAARFLRWLAEALEQPLLLALE